MECFNGTPLPSMMRIPAPRRDMVRPTIPTEQAIRKESLQSLERSLSAREVRALAHPLRLRMLELLRAGPATASMLARELGESSGATSYHLRELHKAGFVDDDPEHASRRERWWKRAPRFLVSTVADDAEYDAALSKLRSVIVERDEDALARYFAAIGDESRDWQEVSFLGGWTLFATPEEIRSLSTLVFQEIGKLHRHPADRTADARAVHVSFRALVQPERPE